MISMVFNAILITALIGDSYNLSIKTGIIFFFVALVPVFIIGGIYGSEFKKENHTKPSLSIFRNHGDGAEPATTGYQL